MRVPICVIYLATLLLLPACTQTSPDQMATFGPPTGADLLKLCQSSEGADRTLCSDHISDAMVGVTRKDCYYHPSGDLRDQYTRDIVVKYLRSHPEKRAAAATEVVTSAFLESFPC